MFHLHENQATSMIYKSHAVYLHEITVNTWNSALSSWNTTGVNLNDILT
jgi:hypothetical protein